MGGPWRRTAGAPSALDPRPRAVTHQRPPPAHREVSIGQTRSADQRASSAQVPFASPAAAGRQACAQHWEPQGRRAETKAADAVTTGGRAKGACAQTPQQSASDRHCAATLSLVDLQTGGLRDPHAQHVGADEVDDVADPEPALHHRESGTPRAILVPRDQAQASQPQRLVVARRSRVPGRAVLDPLAAARTIAARARQRRPTRGAPPLTAMLRQPPAPPQRPLREAPGPFREVVLIELFAGLLSLSLLFRLFGWKFPVISYYSEIDEDARRVIHHHFPDAIDLGDVTSISEDQIRAISEVHPEALLVVAFGPPCVDVSLLKRHRAGAWGPQSALREAGRRVFHWAYASAPQRAIGILECTRMAVEDRKVYDDVFPGGRAFEICARHWVPVTRPRWWWFSCAPTWPEGTRISEPKEGVALVAPPPASTVRAPSREILIPGWSRVSGDESPFACLTRHVPKRVEPNEAAGKSQADADTLDWWRKDEYCQSPYQYCPRNRVTDGRDQRRLLPIEEERLTGVPDEYTWPCQEKGSAGYASLPHRRTRHSLLGNAWNLYALAFIFQAVLRPRLADATMLHEPPPWPGGAGVAQQLWRTTTAPPVRVAPFVAAIIGDSGVHLLKSLFVPSVFLQTAYGVEGPHGAIPPGWSELHQNEMAKHVDVLQVARSVRSGPYSMLLPRGLGPVRHFRFAHALPARFDALPDLPADLALAAEVAVTQSAECLRDWRRAALRRLRGISTRLAGIDRLLAAARSPAAVRVASTWNLAMVEYIRMAIGWPDEGLVELLAKGGAILGAIAETGCFRATSVVPELSVEELLSGARAFIDTLTSRPPHRPDEARRLWELASEEQRQGKIGPWLTRADLDAQFGVDSWSCMPRFVVEQEKPRIIDNAKRAGYNETSHLVERIHTTSTLAGVALVRWLLLRAGGAITAEQIRIATADMKSAYRQIAVRQEFERFSIVCVWDPDTLQWRFALLYGLAFGLANSVLEFNRIAAFINGAGRRVLLLLLLCFYDDFKSTDVDRGEGTSGADEAFQSLCDLLGARLDPDKHRSPAASNRFLGKKESYIGLATCRLEPDEAKVEAFAALLRETLAQGTANVETRQRILGTMVHLSESLPGRLGRARMRLASGILSALDRDRIEYFLYLVQYAGPRHIPLVPRHGVHFMLWTDASYRRSRDASGAITHQVGAGWVLAASAYRGTTLQESFPRVAEAPSETCVHSQPNPGLSGWAGALLQHVLLRGAIGAAYTPPPRPSGRNSASNEPTLRQQS